MGDSPTVPAPCLWPPLPHVAACTSLPTLPSAPAATLHTSSPSLCHFFPSALFPSSPGSNTDPCTPPWLWPLVFQSLAAEVVSLENQLAAASSSSASAGRLEAQLTRASGEVRRQGEELAALTAERRILKARLMQAEARLRSAGLQPLPPLPGNLTGPGVCLCARTHVSHAPARLPYALLCAVAMHQPGCCSQHMPFTMPPPLHTACPLFPTRRCRECAAHRHCSTDRAGGRHCRCAAGAAARPGRPGAGAAGSSRACAARRCPAKLCKELRRCCCQQRGGCCAGGSVRLAASRGPGLC